MASHGVSGSFSALLLLLFLQCRLASSSSSSSSFLSAFFSSFRNHHNHTSLLHHRSSCALFVGTWVRDESYPLYQSSHCPIIDPEFNCQMYGRPDSDYLKYKWKPLDCDLPRFNGLEFLLKMKGKTVMFVGDSLGRNQWQSLICIIHSALPNAQTQLLRGDPLSTFLFLDYGVSLSFYRAPYLVDIDVVEGKRILRLDEINGNGETWRNADVLSFNTGHWWSHQGSLQGWDYVEFRGRYYPDMDRLTALEIGLKTWANWVDKNIDRNRTNVFFQAISPTHYNPKEWDSIKPTARRTTSSSTTTKNCYGETSPISGTTYPGTYPEQMRIVEMVIREMRNPAYLLDITMLSALRKDGHPSIYSGDLSAEQRAKPDFSADCSHWCLPGLPDTWNQLFYTALFS